MSASTIEFIRVLIGAFPALAPPFKEHLEDNFGEVLPHLFIADVARAAVAALTGESDGSFAGFDRGALVRLMSFLEEHYESDGPDIQELLAVSFLEHLPRPDEPGGEIRDMAGPAMREQLRVIG